MNFTTKTCSCKEAKAQAVFNFDLSHVENGSYTYRSCITVLLIELHHLQDLHISEVCQLKMKMSNIVEKSQGYD